MMKAQAAPNMALNGKKCLYKSLHSLRIACLFLQSPQYLLLDYQGGVILLLPSVILRGDYLIAYNSMLLSELLDRSLAAGNEKALDLLRRISPAAWQHLHFLGHDAFRDKHNPIDLDAILAGIDWE
ncbi:MAG: transposase [Burkholderiales bacterium]|nr:transposase [Burkholderiales bacterium]